jgi:hypothetical protein
VSTEGASRRGSSRHDSRAWWQIPDFRFSILNFQFPAELRRKGQQVTRRDSLLPKRSGPPAAATAAGAPGNTVESQIRP